MLGNIGVHIEEFKSENIEISFLVKRNYRNNMPRNRENGVDIIPIPCYNGVIDCEAM